MKKKNKNIVLTKEEDCSIETIEALIEIQKEKERKRGPTDAELKKINRMRYLFHGKESADVYTMPLKDLFKLDEDIEVQDTACDSFDDYNAANRIDRTFY